MPKPFEKHGMWSALAPLSLLALLVSASGCSDEVRESYPTFKAAKEAGVLERGWLHRSFPGSATNLKFANNLDINTSEGSFDLPPEAQRSWFAQLTSISDRDALPFRNLASRLSELETRGFKVARIEDTRSRWFIACNEAEARCVYWMAPLR